MKLIVKETTQTEVELPIPVFFRNYDETEYIGVLDENTVVTIIDQKGYTSIQNCEMWLKKNDIAKAWNSGKEWQGCREFEFLEKYDQVVEKMSLHPILKP
jgi:hypothetical protein